MKLPNEIAKHEFVLHLNWDQMWIGSQPEQAIEPLNSEHTFGFVNYDDSLHVYISCFTSIESKKLSTL